MNRKQACVTIANSVRWETLRPLMSHANKHVRHAARFKALLSGFGGTEEMQKEFSDCEKRVKDYDEHLIKYTEWVVECKRTPDNAVKPLKPADMACPSDAYWTINALSRKVA